MSVEYGSGQNPSAANPSQPVQQTTPASAVAAPSIPATPVDPTPVEGQPAQPGSGTTAAPESGLQSAASDLQTQFAEIASTYGVDAQIFSHCPNIESAYAALQAIVSHNVQSGFGFQPEVPAQPQQQIQQPAQAAAQAAEFTLDLDPETDPKIIAAFKALHQSQQAAIQEARQAREQFDKLQEQQVQTRQIEMLNRANTSIDKIASPKYGVGQNRSFQQKLAVQNLYRIADVLMDRYSANGQVPSIEAIMQQALLMDGHVPQTKPAAPVPPAKPAIPSPAQLLQRTATPSQHTPNVPLDRNPNFIQGVREILARPS